MPTSRLSSRLLAGWALRSCAGWLTPISLTACGVFGAAGPKAATPTRIEPRDTRLVHEECTFTGAGAAFEDVNGDGRPDRRTASAAGGAAASCRSLDFNFDGVVDAWVYLDEAGQVRRRENDYDGDGSVDEISLYRAGVLVEQQRVTGRARKLDTWHYFEHGKMARTERDSNGDDYVDQWWEYPADRPPDCPLIHSDVNADGRPDPGATVDICRERFSAEASAEAPAAAPPGGIGELPTEVEPEAGGDRARGEGGGDAAPGGEGPGAPPAPSGEP